MILLQCRTYQLEIIRSANLDSEEKLTKLESQREHLCDAQKQRRYYNAWRKRAKNSHVYDDEGVERTFSVFSFDFSQISDIRVVLFRLAAHISKLHENASCLAFIMKEMKPKSIT